MRFIIFIIFLLSSCTTIPTPQKRLKDSVSLARQYGWSFNTLTSGPYNLAVATPQKKENSTGIAIYIEGDGFAWLSSSKPSYDPTPINPVALKLALQHPQGNTIYLARPCQYKEVVTGACNSQVWTDGRFSETVIHSMNLAVSTLKEKYQAERVTLIGYSGGGVIAALIAARRDDIEQLITIASPLDHEKWTTDKRISPLALSLNPVSFWAQLQRVPQLHFVGSNDKIVDEQVVRSYAKQFPADSKLEVRVVSDYDHSCCWDDKWAKMLEDIY